MTRVLRRSFLLALAAASVVACGDDSKNAATAATCAAADGSAAKMQQFTAEPPICLQNGTTYEATIETNHGTVHVTLRADIAPNTVNNFVNLARFHYFDGTTCHRVIQSFVVQCGDPTATGNGGPGYEFADELPAEPYRVGSIAMANSGADTNGSQFFIISGARGAALPPRYSLFGQVDDADLPVVAALDAFGNPGDGPPLQPIDIIKVTIDEK